MFPAHQADCVRKKANGWRAGLLACALALGLSGITRADMISEEIFTPGSPINAPSIGSIGWDPFSNAGGGGNRPLGIVFDSQTASVELSLFTGTLDGVMEWAADGSTATVLAPGQTIDGLTSWTSSYTFHSGGNPLMEPGESLYFGYRIYESELGSEYASYGWVQLENIAGTYFLSHWAINYADGGITVPMGEAIPEPSTYAVILGGVALGGALVMRRRKQKASA